MAAGYPFRQAKSGGPREGGPPSFSSSQMNLERDRALEFQCGIRGRISQTELDADIHREFRLGGLGSLALALIVIAPTRVKPAATSEEIATVDARMLQLSP